MTRPHDQPTMILPRVEPDADGTGLWRTRLMLLGGLTAVIAVVVAVAVSVVSSGDRPAASTPAATADAQPAPTDAAPVVTTETVTTTSAVPFPTRTVKGKKARKIRVAGVAGERRDTYQVTYRDGVAVDRKLIRSVVVRQPVPQVVAVGGGKRKPRR